MGVTAAIISAVLCVTLAAVRAEPNCTVFPEILEADYEKTYAGINDAGRRPNGFFRATVAYYNSDDNPCFTVQGQANQAVEIKYETVPPMTLCYENLQNKVVRCDESGRSSECSQMIAATQSYRFFCDSSRGCAEADVSFWVRMTKGPVYSEDTEMMWCGERNEDYPGSLATLPPNFTPKTPEPTIGAASACVFSFTLAVFCNIFLLLCRRYMGYL